MLIAWEALVLGLFLTLSMLVLGIAPWHMPRSGLLRLGLLVGAFCITAATVIALRRWARPIALAASILVSVAAFGAICLLLLLTEKTISRPLLLGSIAITVLLAPLPLAAPRLRAPGLVALGLLLLLSCGLGWQRVHTVALARHQPQVSYANSAFYDLQFTSYEDLIPHPAARGGGLERLGEDYLLGTGDGKLYLLQLGRAGLHARRLPQQVPLNGEAFARHVGGEYREPQLNAMWHGPAAPRIQPWRFRVADLLVQALGPGQHDPLRLFASHHYWQEDKQCFLLRVSMLETSRAALLSASKALPWKTIYDTQPCLPLSGPGAKSGTPFRGEEVGGRMAMPDPRTLLLTVGDLGYSGVESTQVYAQDAAVSYGKTVLIHLDSGTSEIFTLGHRNAQGLYIAPNGDIWQSEHAERGGDELNLLVKGVNYGWPFVTYGTLYSGHIWPLSAEQGRHDGYARPVYAWVPSIGVSSLIGLRGEAFSIWRGDLLVGSLATRSLYRIRVQDRRVVFVEPIVVGKRIRDLLEASDGRVLLWTDDSALVILQPAEGASSRNGELLFQSLCSGCHTRGDGQQHRLGPDLGGILGRKIGAAVGYDTYTQAMRQLEGAWTRERLDRFLAGPQEMAPGTSMAFAGVKDEAQRAALLDYLVK